MNQKTQDNKKGQQTHLRFALTCTAFAALLFTCIFFVYQLIVPKFFYDNDWPTTSTYCGFYQLERHTADVLFFGSSHAASFFIPQELYNSYGITSYNLGCEQQNLVVSYYWLKEALRCQQPKAVILDCYMLFEYNAKEPLNTAESCTRKAMDFMKWSSVKKEAVKTICALDENQSLLSYYFPNLRYHTRWKGLFENDFLAGRRKTHSELKGYAPLAGYCGDSGFVPFERPDGETKTPMVPLMEAYLDKLRLLCEQNSISLILVKNPSTAQTAEKSAAIRDYADRHGLLFLDFNEKSLYEKTGYRFETDNHDGGHGNLWGARKVTNYLGHILKDRSLADSKASPQWEQTKAYYKGIQKDCCLTHISDLDTYLFQLKDSRYSIFIASKGDCTSFLKQSSAGLLARIGCRTNLFETPGSAFFAVISGSNITEQTGMEELTTDGTLSDSSVTYEVLSAAGEGNEKSSIFIDAEERSKNCRGLNFVVYQNDTQRVIDSVCFDTGADTNPAVR